MNPLLYDLFDFGFETVVPPAPVELFSDSFLLGRQMSWDAKVMWKAISGSVTSMPKGSATATDFSGIDQPDRGCPSDLKRTRVLYPESYTVAFLEFEIRSRYWLIFCPAAENGFGGQDALIYYCNGRKVATKLTEAISPDRVLRKEWLTDMREFYEYVIGNVGIGFGDKTVASAALDGVYKHLFIDALYEAEETP